MELNHKKYPIYTEGNKPAKIVNAKEVQVLINDQPNGATLHDIFRSIEEFGTGKIYGWSVLQFYKPENGYLVDNEGNKISLLQGEEKIYFKPIEDPLIIEWEKEVTLDYIRDVSTLLGLNNIEETITGISNEDKQVLVEERMAANELRQREIQKEKEEATAREKQQLEAERKRLEKEQAEEEERLAILKKEEEEKALIEAEEKRKQQELETAEEDKKRKEKEEIENKEKIEAEIKRKKKERLDNENVYTPEQYRDLRKQYLEGGEYTEYITEDGRYIFFFPDVISKETAPFLILRTDEDYEELVDGVGLTINNEKLAEYEFKDKGKDKALTLDKRKDSIRVQVIA